jgi:hypothetical protein
VAPTKSLFTAIHDDDCIWVRRQLPEVRAKLRRHELTSTDVYQANGVLLRVYRLAVFDCPSADAAAF